MESPSDALKRIQCLHKVKKFDTEFTKLKTHNDFINNNQQERLDQIFASFETVSGTSLSIFEEVARGDLIALHQAGFGVDAYILYHTLTNLTNSDQVIKMHICANPPGECKNSNCTRSTTIEYYIVREIALAMGRYDEMMAQLKTAQ